MKGSSLVLTISLASILSVAMLSAVPNDVSGQLSGNFDYRCYTMDTPTITPKDGFQIRLVDQFEDKIHTITNFLEFCNPAFKADSGQPPGTANTLLPHLRCYEIDHQGPDLGIMVTIEDQFFAAAHEHEVLQAVEVCHTVDKESGTLSNSETFLGSGDPGTQNFQIWKCYSITPGADVPTPDRDLYDQFVDASEMGVGTGGLDSRFPPEVVLGKAILLCPPADKHYNENADPEFSEFSNHLVCYEILSQTPFTTPLDLVLNDQISNTDNAVTELDKLCTDAIKTVDIAGTFIPINSIAILLAGGQMTAAWILPALVAVSGIAYGIDIARKYHKDTK